MGKKQAEFAVPQQHVTREKEKSIQEKSWQRWGRGGSRCQEKGEKTWDKKVVGGRTYFSGVGEKSDTGGIPHQQEIGG